MELVIHRDEKKIGGSLVEIRSGSSRIVVDPGLPYEGEARGVDGVLVSRADPDHYLLQGHISPDIPAYMSRGAKELIDITGMFSSLKSRLGNVSVISKPGPFAVGEFMITPYPVDHSAFDALAFLIEAGGKRVFYSGDFRGHMGKSLLFARMVKDPPIGVDCFLMGGTTHMRGESDFPDERAVERRIEEILKGKGNIKFLFASSVNIDRLLSAYRACHRTGSIFVIDLYTAYILDKLRKVYKNIPEFDPKNMAVRFTRAYADKLEEAGLRDLLYVYNKRKIDIFDIGRKKERILMLAGDNPVFPVTLKELGGSEGAKIVYSMWEGYLTEKFRAYAAGKGISIETVHTSGHADADDLKKFASAMNPKTLIPIHTPDPDQYPALFNNVKVLADKEIFCV
ncbi:MAG: MBL fold metallo-hydrolase [Candidatus Omnitrophica bacterium]|nr:MBL fold metallo-hydrolase [Candidatus Omnitrophota bacterium]